MDRSAKCLKSLVGAPRFELGTSCAQGRRATRLRYAPTESSILTYFCKLAAVLPGDAKHRVLLEICGLIFSFAGFACHSRSSRPYARMNLVQSRFRECTSERKWE